MNTEEMKRHLAKPIEVPLDEDDLEGDKIGMAPLKIDDLPELIDLQTQMASIVKDDTISISKELSSRIVVLLRKSIVAGNPEIKDVNIINEFIASNFIKLMPKLFEVNTLSSGRDKIKAEKIKKIKDRLDGNVSAGASSE